MATSDPEPTVGDLVAAAKAAAPGSIRVGNTVITYQGEYVHWREADDAAGD